MSTVYVAYCLKCKRDHRSNTAIFRTHRKHLHANCKVHATPLRHLKSTQ